MTSEPIRRAISNRLHSAATVEVSSAGTLGLGWLIRLRWLAVAGQLAMWWLSRDWLALDVQTAPALAVAGAMAVSNLALLWCGKRLREDALIAVVACVDVLALTLFLYFTGKEASPFSAFYVVNVAIAARIAAPWVTMLVWLLSSAAFGSLFLLTGHQGAHATHYRGMWVAYAFASAAAAFFVSRVSSALADRERRLAQLQRSAQAAQRLAATSTLAASAAHELGTPLGTVAMLAEGMASEPSLSERHRKDAAVILDQVTRCRDIVRDLDGHSAAADSFSRVPLSQTVRDVVSALDARRVSVDAPQALAALLPRRAFARVVSSLVKNALDAGSHRIAVAVKPTPDGFALRVSDDGPGIAPQVLDRLGEPYLSTKPAGSGSGLGLYLCSVFAEAMRGTLHVETSKRGTVVELWVPSHG